ncbi:MAG: 4-hydroxy-3-methylbut-2-enyl diphosphate reductase [Chloroflexi bacterium]|nr:4-hydroxy-3-methylbut-2-enyl diphosphate reductase [Chloroflexota bacterium]
MEVIRITPRGYCHGVVKAINIARDLAGYVEGPIFAVGQLVHNRHVVEDLAHRGITVLDGEDRMSILESIDHGSVIFSAHGVSPELRRRAIERGLRWFDATCPDVVRTHDLAREKVEQGYFILYIGKRGHPEPEGVLGEVPSDRALLIEEVADVDALELSEAKIAILTQTTISVWDTEAIAAAILERYPQAEIHNEICRATQERQAAAVEIGRTCDVVIVVGDRRSSNSRRLVEVVQQRAHRPAYLVDGAAEIEPRWFVGVTRVGVTSGASTPSEVTRAVIEHLQMLSPVPA